MGDSDRVPDSERADLLENFEARRQLFFSGDHRLPEGLIPMSVLHDGGDGVVVSFDARGQRGLWGPAAGLPALEFGELRPNLLRITKGLAIKADALEPVVQPH